ncbi:MAG: leucine-rich repeat domain-containing protein [Archangiaceae bacterium]|nr:leucine-rich repeat domain-containing protein [Archangiaceae bacterium]
MSEPELVSLTINYAKNQTVDESLAARTDLEELQLRNVPPGTLLPELLRALPKLKVLGLTGKDDVLQVPALVGELKLEKLELWDAKAPELPPLPLIRQLYFVTEAPETDVPALLEKAPQLERLELHGSHLKGRTLPDAIGDFANLHELMINNCGLTKLPDALGKLPLEELTLVHNSFTALPDVVCTLTSLKRLIVSEALAKLPDALANLTRLTELRLGGSLNKGESLYDRDEAKKMKDVPVVLASLTGLEVLSLGRCGVRDGANFEKLCASLTNLKTLNLEAAGLTSLEVLAPLKQLTSLTLDSVKTLKSLAGIEALTELQELSLESAEIRDISHLTQLKKLKKLNLEYFETKDLGPVYELDVELTADEEVLEKYKARSALRGVPPFELLLPKLGSLDPSLVAKTFEQLTARSAVASGKKSALVAALAGFKLRDALSESLGATLVDQDEEEEEEPPEEEDEDLDEEDFDEDEYSDDDDESDDDDADEESDQLISLPLLESALDRHRGSIPPLILGKLFGAVLRNVSANIPAALMIAREMQERGDDAAQLALVEGFKQACEYYDPGHRMFEDTMQDRLIDDVFPLLGAAAQTELLTWASDDALQSDQLDACFGPALERANPEQREKLVARLEKHLGNRMRDLERIDALLASITDAGPNAKAAAELARQRLDEKLAEAKRRKTLEADLESDTAERVAAALTTLEGDEALAKDLQGALWDANNCKGLPLEATRTLVALWSTLDHDRGLREAFARGVETHGVEAMADSATALGLDGLELASFLRRAARELKTSKRVKVDEALLDQLRAWATSLDGMTPLMAKSTELRDTLFEAAQQYDQKAIAQGISTLAELEAFTPAPLDEDAREGWSQFATVIADMAGSQEWKPLKLLVRHLHKLPLPPKTKERILAQLIGVCSQGKDAEGLKLAISLAPEVPEWDILAFNLACVTAASGDKAAALKHTRRALELGKPPSQFLSDSDFKALRQDEDFKALLLEFGGDEAPEAEEEDELEAADDDDAEADDDDLVEFTVTNDSGQEMTLKAPQDELDLGMSVGVVQATLVSGDWFEDAHTMILGGNRMLIDSVSLDGEDVTITGSFEPLED